MEAKNQAENAPRKNVAAQFAALCVRLGVKPLNAALILALAVALLSTTAIYAVTRSRSSRTVDFGLKNIGELATQAGYYTNVQVIENAANLWGWNIPLTQSKCIYSYDGVIKVGYDFEKIEIDTNDRTKTITVRLPEAVVISNQVIDGSLKVYDERHSIFTPFSVSDTDEAMSMLKAEGLQNAVNNGIYEAARENAEVLLRGMMMGLAGYEDYNIVFEHRPL